MAMTSDELDFNPVYKQLQCSYQNKFEEAQRKCWTVCIPCSSSLRGVKITEQFIDYHILKPSPYFKSHFITTDKKESRTFEIDGCIIQTRGGPVKILSEELGYNKEYKPFKILIMEKPLDPIFCEKVVIEDSSTAACSVDIRNSKFSAVECKAFLQSFPEHKEILVILEKKLKQFINNYMVLQQYLQEAASKLEDLVNWASQVLLESHNPPLDQHDPYTADISAAVECYIMQSVHHKVFPVVRKKCAQEDKEMTDKLQILYNMGVTPDQFGAKGHYCCSTPRAIVELASLEDKSSPAQKLLCLKATLERLTDDVQEFLQESFIPLKQNGDIPCLTSDDLIPLLLSVMVQTRPQHLESNLYYIQNFCWKFSTKDKLSFSLVTFQAAKEFVKTYNLSHLKPSKNKLKKEMSLEELMEVNMELQKPSEQNYDSRNLAKGSTLIDRQLQKITRMIEASTSELREHTEQRAVNIGSGQKLNNTTSNEGLGEFFSSLQNSLGFSYGKQS